MRVYQPTRPAALEVTPGSHRVSVLNPGSRNGWRRATPQSRRLGLLRRLPWRSGATGPRMPVASTKRTSCARKRESLPQVRRSGRKVIYDPRVKVTHVGSVIARRDRAHFARSTEHFTSKNLHAHWRWRLSRAIHVGLLHHF
jgi:hypothetical protein